MSKDLTPTLSVTDNRTGRQYEIPIARNTIQAIDLKNIVSPDSQKDSADLNSHGLRVLDEGYRNTAPVQTSISHIDPDAGSLQYRQHAIQDLFRKYGFEDCTHLLVWNSLPSTAQRSGLASKFAASMTLPEAVTSVVKSFPKDAPIMTIIMAALSAWASVAPQAIPVIASTNIYDNVEQVDQDIPRTLSALGVAVALAYCHRNGMEPMQPRADFSFVENLLLMMGFAEAGTRPDSKQVADLSSILLLHAEHGMCNSTAAFLHAASTGADPISCLVAAIVAIYGPLHGGSNIITYQQIKSIGNVDKIPEVISEVQNRKRRLFGFGHRIYNTIDPRATLLRGLIEEFREEGREVPYLDVAVELERQVSTDAFFIKRHIRANTDLFTVLAYQAMGLPEELVFPFICISRAQGFLAHWREFVDQKSPNWRPQQIFTGNVVKTAHPKL